MLLKLKTAIDIAFSPKYLIFSNTFIGINFLTIADFMQQYINYRSKKQLEDKYIHDYRRTYSMMAGGCYFGIGGHYWYRFLERRYPGNSRNSMKKKVISEIVFGPPYVSLCLVFVKLLEGHGLQKIKIDLKDNFKFICLSEWMFYLPFQVINFYFLPPKYRYLFVGCVTLVYDNILAFVFHKVPVS